jgi:hypothetical protein
VSFESTRQPASLRRARGRAAASCGVLAVLVAAIGSASSATWLVIAAFAAAAALLATARVLAVNPGRVIGAHDPFAAKPPQVARESERAAPRVDRGASLPDVLDALRRHRIEHARACGFGLDLRCHGGIEHGPFDARDLFAAIDTLIAVILERGGGSVVEVRIAHDVARRCLKITVGSDAADGAIPARPHAASEAFDRLGALPRQEPRAPTGGRVAFELPLLPVRV